MSDDDLGESPATPEHGDAELEPDATATAGEKPPGRRNGRWVIAGIIVIAAAAGAALLVSIDSEEKHDISGTIVLTDTDVEFDGICSGDGGYSDLQIGLGATVKDGAGKILATGAVGASHGTGSTCVLAFVIEDVPKTDFYIVEVGHRGELTYNYDEMVGNNWELELTIGD